MIDQSRENHTKKNEAKSTEEAETKKRTIENIERSIYHNYEK